MVYFTGLERFEFSRIRRNHDAEHRRTGVEWNRAQQHLHATGVHAVSSGSDDGEVSHQSG